MILRIKNMVCPRCIMAVRTILVSMGLTPKTIDLGDVEIDEELNDTQKATLSLELQNIGI